jgi:hypothetical protein
MLNEKETILDEKNEIEREMNGSKKDWKKKRERGKEVRI